MYPVDCATGLQVYNTATGTPPSETALASRYPATGTPPSGTALAVPDVASIASFPDADITVIVLVPAVTSGCLVVTIVLGRFLGTSSIVAPAGLTWTIDCLPTSTSFPLDTDAMTATAQNCSGCT